MLENKVKLLHPKPEKVSNKPLMFSSEIPRLFNSSINEPSVSLIGILKNDILGFNNYKNDSKSYIQKNYWTKEEVISSLNTNRIKNS